MSTEEEWILQLTLGELQWFQAALTEDLKNAAAAGARPDSTVRLMGKVNRAIKEARNWHTPLSELVNTPSRGELPDA